MATPTSIVLITTLLAVTAACARPVSSQSLRAGRGTVLPAGSAADIVRQCSRGTPGPVDGVWTPTSESVCRKAADRAIEQAHPGVREPVWGVAGEVTGLHASPGQRSSASGIISSLIGKELCDDR